MKIEQELLAVSLSRFEYWASPTLGRGQNRKKVLQMIGYIDVGGGMRDIYGSGVLDRCIDDAVSFDCMIGVSAGAANVLSFLAGQRGRNYVFFHDYSFRKEYMSFGNFFRGRRFFNLDYVYNTLSGVGGEYPLDLIKAKEYDGLVNIVTTDGRSGEVKYFTLDDIRPNDFTVIKATCALPIFCKEQVIDGRVYFDGGLANPIPLDRAFELGCDKVVLTLTRPVEIHRNSVRDDRTAKFIERQYPAVAEALHNRAALYNETADRALELQEEGKVLVIAPDDTCGVDTLKKTKEGLQALYDKGYADAAKIAEFVRG